MKKVILILLIALTSIGASAKFRWGPTVGVNFTDFYWKQHLVESDMLTGFDAGIMGEVMIPGIGFGIDMAVRYSMRGAKVHFGDQKIWAADGFGTSNLYCHTLQVPINLRFKWTRMNGVENYVAPIVFAGPVFNFNLKYMNAEAIDNSGGSVGLQCGAGVELFKRFQITGGYMWDVTYDLRTKKLDNFSARMQGGFITVAVLF